MIDVCGDSLAFRRRFRDDLKVPTVRHFETDGVSQIKEWAMSENNKKRQGSPFWYGGASIRTPGEYYTNKDEGGFETNEYIHPSVRRRLMKNRDSNESQWKPPALNDFDLVKNQDGSAWAWVKLSDERQKDIIIREWMPKHLDNGLPEGEEAAMIPESEMRLLENDAECEGLKIPKMQPHNRVKLALKVFIFLITAGYFFYYAHQKKTT